MPGSYSLTTKLLKPLEKFFIAQKTPVKVLLALSGGPDSMALFYALMKVRETYPFELAVAHVDHRWRKESAHEAQFLEELAGSFSIPFFMKILDPSKLDGNLEEACRKCRYAFFQEVAEKEGYQYLFLGHHQGDQVETVLKRICEGAHLGALQGMKEEACLNNLMLVRPWLKVPKEAILSFLKEENLSYFEDPTNNYNKFLRSRMRTEILPLLEKAFNKNIASNLSFFSSEMARLDAYMEQRIAPLYEQIVSGPFGWVLLQSQVHSFEAHYFLKQWFRKQNVEISRQALDQVVTLYGENAANKFVETAQYRIAIDRGRVFVLHRKMPAIDVWKEVPMDNEGEPGWKSVFSGFAYFTTSKSKSVYFEAIPSSPEKRKLAKKLAEQRIPLYLRDAVPFLIGPDGKIDDPFIKKADFSSLRLKGTLLKLGE